MKNNGIFSFCNNIFFIFILLLNSCTDLETQQNKEDIYKIQYNMHLKQVDSVMRNKPIYIMNNEPQYLFLYYYKNNTFGVSDDLCIVFSMKDSLVTHIYYGD